MEPFRHSQRPSCAFSPSFPPTKTTTVLTSVSGIEFCLVWNFVYMEPLSLSPSTLYTPATLWEVPPNTILGAVHNLRSLTALHSPRWPRPVYSSILLTTTWGSSTLGLLPNNMALNIIAHIVWCTDTHTSAEYCISFLLLLRQSTTKFSA